MHPILKALLKRKLLLLIKNSKV